MDDDKIIDRIDRVRTEAKSEVKDMEDRLGRAVDRVREEAVRGYSILDGKLDQLGQRLLDATTHQTTDLKLVISEQGKKLDDHETSDDKRFAEANSKFQKVFWYIAYACGGLGALVLLMEGIHLWVTIKKE